MKGSENNQQFEAQPWPLAIGLLATCVTMLLAAIAHARPETIVFRAGVVFVVAVFGTWVVRNVVRILIDEED